MIILWFLATAYVVLSAIACSLWFIIVGIIRFARRAVPAP
jgi:hypothetical protein